MISVVGRIATLLLLAWLPGTQSGCTALFESQKADAGAGSEDASDCQQLRDPNGACVECLVPDDCESKICDERSHECIDGARAVYLSEAGADDSSECSRESPCATFGRALQVVDADRDWIMLLPGSFFGPMVLSGNPIGVSSLTLYGAGATVYRGDGDILSVTKRAHLEVLGLTLNGSPTGGSPQYDGISCNDADLELHGVTILKAHRDGMRLQGCKVIIDRSRISESAYMGIGVYEGDLTITNSIISQNGVADPFSVGGIEIDPGSEGAEVQLAFNTIVDNDSGGPTGVGGIRCEAAEGILAMSSAGNLVVDNTGSTPNATATCVLSHSVVQGWTSSDVLDVEVVFHPSSSQYELADDEANAMIVDVPSLDVVVIERDLDYAGGPRVVGSHPDMGAQELDR